MRNIRRTIVIVAMLCALVVSAQAEPPLRPDPALTPGDVLTTDTTVIYKPHYTDTVRDVPQSLKNRVYKNYGVTTRPRAYRPHASLPSAARPQDGSPALAAPSSAKRDADSRTYS